VKRFDFARPIRDESCESTRIATISHPPSYCLARVDFRETIRLCNSDSRRIVRTESNRNNFTPPVIAYRKSISGETIRLCKRRFVTNRPNRIESQQFHTPCYCLPQVDFRWDDSTLQKTIRDESGESTRIVKKFTPQLLPTASKLPGKRFHFARNIPDQSSRFVKCFTESTEVCRDVFRTTNVHLSLFHGYWLPVVRIDSVRIESNR